VNPIFDGFGWSFKLNEFRHRLVTGISRELNGLVARLRNYSAEADEDY
jgi:hypothetical protein